MKHFTCGENLIGLNCELLGFCDLAGQEPKKELVLHLFLPTVHNASFTAPVKRTVGMVKC